MKRTADYFEWL